MEQPVTTRLADGSPVRMTPSELRADLEAGAAAGAKRAKVPPLEPDELERLLEIFASNARFTAVDAGDELVAVVRRLGQHGFRHPHRRALQLPEPPRRRHPRALPHRLLLQGGQDRPLVRAAGDEERAAQPGDAAAVRRHARPGTLLAARRSGAQLVRAHAPGPHRRGPRRPGRGRRARRARHGVRRRGHDRGRRRRSRLRHRRRRRRRRLPRGAARGRGDPPALPRHRHRARHGERVRARHARRARVPRAAPGRPVAARPGRRGRRGRGHHVRAGRERQHHAARWPGTWPAP